MLRREKQRERYKTRTGEERMETGEVLLSPEQLMNHSLRNRAGSAAPNSPGRQAASRIWQSQDSARHAALVQRVYACVKPFVVELSSGCAVMSVTPVSIASVSLAMRAGFAALDEVKNLRSTAPVDYIKYRLSQRQKRAEETAALRTSTSASMDDDDEDNGAAMLLMLRDVMAQLQCLRVVRGNALNVRVEVTDMSRSGGDAADVQYVNATARCMSTEGKEEEGVRGEIGVEEQHGSAAREGHAEASGAVATLAAAAADTLISPPLDVGVFARLSQLELLGVDIPPRGIENMHALGGTLTSLVVVDTHVASLRQLLLPSGGRAGFGVKATGGGVGGGGTMSGNEAREKFLPRPLWPRLETLVCCRCNLEILDAASLSQLPAVTRIDLSQNRLASMEHIDRCVRLAHLDVSFNRITDLSDARRQVGNLSTLVLQHNGISDVSGLSKLYSLEALDVSGNLICTRDSLTGVCALPCLRSLWIAGNPVTLLQGYRIAMLSCFDEPQCVELDGRVSDDWEVVAAAAAGRRMSNRRRATLGAQVASMRVSGCEREKEGESLAALSSSTLARPSSHHHHHHNHQQQQEQDEEEHQQDEVSPSAPKSLRWWDRFRSTLSTQASMSASKRRRASVSFSGLAEPLLEDLDEGFLCTYVINDEYIAATAPIHASLDHVVEAPSMSSARENMSTDGMGIDTAAAAVEEENDTTNGGDAHSHRPPGSRSFESLSSSPPRYDGAVIRSARRSFTLAASVMQDDDARSARRLKQREARRRDDAMLAMLVYGNAESSDDDGFDFSDDDDESGSETESEGSEKLY